MAKRPGSCDRCGEALEWGPPGCPGQVWVHTDPLDCIKYMKAGMAKRTKLEIESEIRRIESDARYSYPAADVFVNAPLALIQVDMKARVDALRWVLSGERS